jgi:hypothetical protein
VKAWLLDGAGREQDLITHRASLYSTHRLLDARGLALHALIAEKIRSDPQLLDVAHNNLQRWRGRWQQQPPAWFEEWLQIMSWPWPRIAALITEQSENAIRLRQSSPFAGVLNAAERKRIYEAFRTRAPNPSRGLDR